MSKVLYICKRKKVINKNDFSNLEKVCHQIKPSNITPNKPFIDVKDGIMTAVFNPNEDILLESQNVCVGNILTYEKEWKNIELKNLDGSFAIFRANKDEVEIISDFVGSRTIFFVFTNNELIASTSQRMIISYLRDFQPNREAYSWMLSTGALGGVSWDSRIKVLKPATKLTLNRYSWELTEKKEYVKFKPLNLSPREHRIRLENSIDNTLKKLDLNLEKWWLPLSGGYDSRGILQHLPHHKLNTLTWGTMDALNERKSDAYIAEILSEKYSTNHKYFETNNINADNIEEIVERFLKNGEGRIDHISGYLDGFEIWKNLFEENISGIIRGDEGFGWGSANTEKQVRSILNIFHINEFKNLKEISHKEKLPQNTLDQHLERRRDETLATWRDRLYHEYRIPVMLSSLNDLKLPYVEIINPLLSKEVINTVREIPDKLRTNKTLFKSIVNKADKEIPYAQSDSNISLNSFLKNPIVYKYIRKELYETKVFSSSFINDVLKNQYYSGRDEKSNNKINRVRSKLLHYAPANLKSLLKTLQPKTLDHNQLAFRVLIISKMDEILKEDARMLKKVNMN